MKTNLSATREELAKACGFSLATVKRALKKLTYNGYIFGKTYNKSGEWIINK